MKKFTYLLFLAIGVTACSVESMDSNENLLTADASAKMKKDFLVTVSSDPITEYTFTSGNSGNNKARLFVSNTCDVITLVFTPLNEDDISVKFDIFKTLPSVNVNNGNGNETLPNGTITLDETDLDENNSYSVSFENLGVIATDNVFIFARMGNEYAGSQILGDWEYFTYNISEEICDEPSCESGYMIGDKNFNEIGTSNNWGWAHKFEFEGSGSETRDIQHKNGSLGGSVMVSYNNGVITVEEGNGVSISHMYISNDEPMETNAPGKFDKNQTYTDDDGSFWVMIKAEVCK